MVARSELPPSERDFETYRLVKVELKSTREAAEVIGVSQTRVCQILTRVEAFLLGVAVCAEDKESRERRLYVARQIAAERLDYFQAQAMQGFVRSQGEAVAVRESQTLGSPVTTVTMVRSTAGDCRYLLAAARMALLAAKVPALSVTESLYAPSPEDCSTSDAAQDTARNVAHSEIAASDSDAENYVSEIATSGQRERPLSGPVKPLPFLPARKQTSATLDRPLTKKERRARRALLAKTG